MTVITINPEEDKTGDVIELFMLIDEMKKAGIFVRLTKEEGEHFAVIDSKLVWHGGMNLLGRADVWDNLIRIENTAAASELLEISEKDME